MIVGAGGHFCPVARHLRGTADTLPPRSSPRKQSFALAREMDWRMPPPELLFCRDLEGYGWCVRKGDYLNVGLGRRASRDFADAPPKLHHAARAKRPPERRERTSAGAGHAYFASGVGPRPLIGPGALTVGDSAGLAYPESGEGIQPAIASGRLAAETLIAGRRPICGGRPAALCRRLEPSPPTDTPTLAWDSRSVGRHRPRASVIVPVHETRAARPLVPAQGHCLEPLRGATDNTDNTGRHGQHDNRWSRG